MKVVILAGGIGSRLQEETTVKPKPMVEIGGFPILWHIMKGYATWGYNEFVVALGYKGDVIKNYFMNYYHLTRDVTVRLDKGQVHVIDEPQPREDWLVHLVDTGARTDTGGRVKRLHNRIGRETFMLTYGDGVSDINIQKLLAFHRAQGKLATMSVVRPSARFGNVELAGDQIARFEEKPRTGEGWINGGFFVLEPEVFEYIAGDDTTFEREPLERLAAEGQLTAYRHEGFWQCMDTLRDVRLLESLWQTHNPPWKCW
jgi:glucose-1-phosphate cytidylyltransferase